MYNTPVEKVWGDFLMRVAHLTAVSPHGQCEWFEVWVGRMSSLIARAKDASLDNGSILLNLNYYNSNKAYADETMQYLQ